MKKIFFVFFVGRGRAEDDAVVTDEDPFASVNDEAAWNLFDPVKSFKK